MPMYEYQCNSCGHKVEILQKISDAALTICPHCQISNISRIISPTGFQLKGSGWYVTDYTNKKPKAAADINATSKAHTTDSAPTAAQGSATNATTST